MILTRNEILNDIKKKRIIIKPFSNSQIGPASIDLTLSNEIRLFKRRILPFKIEEDSDFKKITSPRKIKSFVLYPNEFILAITREKIKLPPDVCGWLTGRSRFARLGLAIHITASFIQPGINNRQVLEIKNVSNSPLKLFPGARICQMILEKTKGRAKYAGRFAKQDF